MNPKYADMLITELLIDYKKTKNHESLNEVYDRLMFCGVEKKIIDSFIELENNIIEKRKIKWNRPLYNTYVWMENIKKKEYKKIFDSPLGEYLIMYNKKEWYTNKTLTTSELALYINEATYIDGLYKKITKDLKNEIHNCGELNQDKYLLRKENSYRLMTCYEKVYKKEAPDTIIQAANRLLTNELHILNLCKFVYPLNVQNKVQMRWTPYTDEYYRFYD